MDEIAMSMRPDAVAANSAWKPRSWISMSAPSRLPISLTRSTSKPSKVPASVLFSHGVGRIGADDERFGARRLDPAQGQHDGGESAEQLTTIH